MTIYPQVELGSIATEYEPYGLIEEPIFEPIDQAHDGKTLTFENTYNDAAEVTVFGESTQEGEPTPEAPVPIESIKSVELVSSNEDGSKSATRTIDLQGHELRSLPDGTRDELVVHRDGTVELVQMVYQVMMHDMLWNRMPVVEYPNGYVFYAYDFILPQRIKHNAFASSDYVNSGAGTYYRTMKHNYMVCGNGGTGTSCWLRNDDYTEVVDLEASLGDATLDYPLATPQTIQLPSIDPLPTYHQYTFVDGNGADISARVRVFE